MNIFRNMPRAAQIAKQRANEQRAIDSRIQMRAPKSPAGKQPGVWQTILALLERTDAAKAIAEDAKATAEKASRPGRAKAQEIIRSRGK